MQYKLVLQNHVDGITLKSWSFKPPVTVGREPNSEVCIDHDSVSRKHCQFSLSGDESLVIRDLDSLNGTYVNEKRIQQAVLMPGQTVQIGALRLQVQFMTEDEAMQQTRQSPQGNVYATQPMRAFQPVPLPPEKPWWQRIFG